MTQTEKTLIALAAAGVVIGFISTHKRPKAYPEGAELDQYAWLINQPGQRSRFINNGQLYTTLYLDTDGNTSTYEYVAADLRDIHVVGEKAVFDYKKAVDMLKTGDCRTLAEWKKVAPNIIIGKYVKSR